MNPPSHEDARSSAISTLTLGCSQLGGLFRPISDEEARKVLESAWELGIRRFDTAPHYGAGLSERRLGRFLQQFKPEEFYISTKVGRLLVPDSDVPEGNEGFFGSDPYRRVWDFSARGVERSWEQSLERLGLPRVNVLYLHDPEEEHLQPAIEEGAPALAALRAKSSIDGFGAGMNVVEPLTRIVLETQADVIMEAGRYTLLDRSGERLIDLCSVQGVSVTAAGIYNSGLLADPRSKAKSNYNYSPASAELIARAGALATICDRFQLPLRVAAVQFALRHSAVRYVAVGARSPAQVRDAVAGLTWDVPEELWPLLAEV